MTENDDTLVEDDMFDFDEPTGVFVETSLSGDEARVLREIVKRLELGHNRYGQLNLDSDKRDLVVESLEEILDGMVYLACKIVQLKDGGGT